MSYCNWDKSSPANIKYHDEEWGVPVHDDQKQFEFLMMEVMQCGLNWNMMINKREILKKCFDGFNYEKIALYGQKDVDRIMQTQGMIKSLRKIEAVIHNAKCFVKLRAEFESFDAYLWGYSGYKTILYDRHNEGYIPTYNGLALKISNDLKKRGFKFVGPTTIYSHLQACGIINDHDKNCARYHAIVAHYPTTHKPCDKEEGVCFYGK